MDSRNNQAKKIYYKKEVENNTLLKSMVPGYN